MTDATDTGKARDFNAWAAQRAAYGLPIDEEAFAAWHEALEAQERDRMRAMLAG